MHHSMTLVTLLLIQACAWRFAPLWVMGPVLLVVFGYAVYLSTKQTTAWRHFTGLCFACAALISLVAGFETLWPCELGCSDGKIYASIFDIEILHAAVVIYAGTALALLWNKQNCCERVVRSIGFILLGTSLFYLGLSVLLEVLCPRCLAIHTTVLSAGVLLWAQGSATWRSLGLILDGILLMLGVYALSSAMAPSLPTDETEPDDQTQGINAFMGAQQQAPNYDQDLLQAIEKGRSLGDTKAPYQLSIYIRLGCTHCARLLPQIYKDAKRITDQGHVQLRFRYLINRQSKKDIQRHYLVLAAASQDQLDLAQSALIGTEAERIGFDDSLIAFGVDPQTLHRLIEPKTSTFEQINLRDVQLLNKATQSASQTPFYFLIKDGKIMKEWDGSTQWAIISNYLQELKP